jgi:hypothetical protein
MVNPIICTRPRGACRCRRPSRRWIGHSGSARSVSAASVCPPYPPRAALPLNADEGHDGRDGHDDENCRALVVAVNPLPALGVAPEIRPALLLAAATPSHELEAVEVSVCSQSVPPMPRPPTPCGPVTRTLCAPSNQTRRPNPQVARSGLEQSIAYLKPSPTRLQLRLAAQALEDAFARLPTLIQQALVAALALAFVAWWSGLSAEDATTQLAAVGDWIQSSVYQSRLQQHVREVVGAQLADESRLASNPAQELLNIEDGV